MRLDARFHHTISQCSVFSTSWNRTAVRFEEIEKFLLKSHGVAMSRQKFFELCYVNELFWRKHSFSKHRKKFLSEKLNLLLPLKCKSSPSPELGLSHVLSASSKSSEMSAVCLSVFSLCLSFFYSYSLGLLSFERFKKIWPSRSQKINPGLNIFTCLRKWDKKEGDFDKKSKPTVSNFIFWYLWHLKNAYDNDLCVNISSFSLSDLGIWNRVALRNRMLKPSV